MSEEKTAESSESGCADEVSSVSLAECTNELLDPAWVEQEEKKLEEAFGHFSFKVVYDEEQQKVAYYCEACESSMNAKKMLVAHVTGARHLKRYQEYKEAKEKGLKITKRVWGVNDSDAVAPKKRRLVGRVLKTLEESMKITQEAGDTFVDSMNTELSNFEGSMKFEKESISPRRSFDRATYNERNFFRPTRPFRPIRPFSPMGHRHPRGPFQPNPPRGYFQPTGPVLEHMRFRGPRTRTSNLVRSEEKFSSKPFEDEFEYPISSPTKFTHKSNRFSEDETGLENVESSTSGTSAMKFDSTTKNNDQIGSSSVKVALEKNKDSLRTSEDHPLKLRSTGQDLGSVLVKVDPESLASGGSTGLLLKKLASCVIKNEKDAELALTVSDSLVTSLREHYTRKGELKIAELLMSAEQKINTLKAMKVGLKLLQKELQSDSKKYNQSNSTISVNTSVPPPEVKRFGSVDRSPASLNFQTDNDLYSDTTSNHSAVVDFSRPPPAVSVTGANLSVPPPTYFAPPRFASPQHSSKPPYNKITRASSFPTDFQQFPYAHSDQTYF